MTTGQTGKEFQELVGKKWENRWKECEQKVVMDFAEEYKAFLDNGKTERLSSLEIEKALLSEGFSNVTNSDIENLSLKSGDKVYFKYNDKNIFAYVIGTASIDEGARIVASHIDSPRIDLKGNPLYESDDLAMFKTHYYGGIKKYQWTSIPLALYGNIIRKDGSSVEISVGDDPSDPIFMISDLLPHLAKDQMGKTLAEGITGEGLNVIIGSIPYADNEVSEKVKLNVLSILHSKYGIIEEDFTSAELEIVPAGKARDIGFDRGLLAAYGHDDRVCAFTSLKALLESKEPYYTSVGVFVDKEEIGSVGSTGMHSDLFRNSLAEIYLACSQSYSEVKFRRMMTKSKVLSGDVNVAFDPNYPDATEKRNTSFLGRGVCLTKYTGSRGKSGCNDANSEFVGEVRKIFNDAGVSWQIGELGKVDQGGGGTVAYILARYGMDVIDCGVPVLSMHAPFEIVSKLDVYMTYKGYKAFYMAK